MSGKNVIVRGATAALLGVLVLAQGQAMSEDPARRGPAVDLVLHGNTPTLAWSPDSTRVVVNASYTYFGFDAAIEQHKDQLGIWVVDAATGASTRVGTDQGYHPLWLDDANVAWGHSVYEAGTAGLYRSPADRSEVSRIGTVEGVHHTLLAKDGGVLYYSGFPEGTGWTRLDLTTAPPEPGPWGAAPPTAPPEPGPWGAAPPTAPPEPVRLDGVTEDSWTAPTALSVDQCPQRVGSVALSRGFERGKQRIFIVRDGKKAALAGEPYSFGVGDPWLPDAHKGLVRACLSPNGQRVAWFVKGAEGEYNLRVGAVPTR